MIDLIHPDRLKEKLTDLMRYHNFILEQYYQEDPVTFESTYESLLKAAKTLVPMMTDVTELLHQSRVQSLKILFEGAQGSLLDIDHGTYPFVTSSNTTAGAVSTGAGFGPTYLDAVLGVVKAYTTRVGAGPFPTELNDDVGSTLGERGHEFGTTTGRARRCGWLDLPCLKRSVQLNGMTSIALTKLDVLDTLSEINVCVAYHINGQRYESLPADLVQLEKAEPEYISFQGWQSSTVGMSQWDDLPALAKAYIGAIEDHLGVPIDIVSTGPGRNETLFSSQTNRCLIGAEERT